MVATLLKFLVVGIVGFVVVYLLIDTLGSCVPTFHRCNTLCASFCNSSVLVDGNIRNSANCLRGVVVLAVRIVVIPLLLANFVVIVVREIVALVAYSVVVDTIEVVVLVVHGVAAVDTIEIVVSTVANYIVVAAEVVVVAVANFVADVAYSLIDLFNSEHFRVVFFGRDRVVTRLPEPQLTLVGLEVS